jgi:hypothetical protein
MMFWIFDFIGNHNCIGLKLYCLSNEQICIAVRSKNFNGKIIRMGSDYFQCLFANAALAREI